MPLRPALFALHADLERRHWWFQGRAEIIAALVEQLTRGRAADIVDVGCGTGAMVRRLAPRHRVTGFDPSPDAVRLARTLDASVSIERVAGVPGMLPALAQARIVLLMDVLEHVRDDFLLFSEIFSALAPGTLLLATVPADPALWSAHDVAFEHYRRYTRPRFEQLWQGLPVSARLIAPLNHRLRPMIRMARRLRGSRSGGDLSLPIAPVNSVLRQILASERAELLQALSHGIHELPGMGVSWLALLQREYGASPVRKRPSEAAADQYDPEEAGHVAA